MGSLACGRPRPALAATRTRITRRRPKAEEQAPPPDMEQVIDRVLALLAGEAVDLGDVPLDFGAAPRVPPARLRHRAHHPRPARP